MFAKFSNAKIKLNIQVSYVEDWDRSIGHDKTTHFLIDLILIAGATLVHGIANFITNV